MNVAAQVQRVSLGAGSRVALVHDAGSTSYGQLERNAARGAGALAALGVLPSDRVALVLPNCPDFVEAYLGVLRLGAIAVSVSVTWPDAAIVAALADAMPRVVITTAELRDRLGASTAGGIVLTADDAASRPGSWRALTARASEIPTVTRTSLTEPAAVLYSSGTTGDPKGVVLSHGNILFNAVAKRVHLGLGAGDALPLFLPVTHVYGQNAVLTSALCAGAAAILQRRFDEDAVVHAVERQGATLLCAVPPVLGRLVETGAAARMRGLRAAFSAASTLPPMLADSWQAVSGRPVLEGYGLTEASPFVTFAGIRRVAGSVGRPIDGVTLRLADPESGEPVADGEAGEVLVQGPNVMLGYWRRPEESARAVRDGWLRTGDLGTLEGGALRLTGRLAERLTRGGFKIGPEEVEHAVARHPAVREAAAFGVPAGHGDERIELAVVLLPGARASDEELLEHCRARLPGWAVPARVHRIATLPRNAAGKLLRVSLGRELGTPAAAP
jgi:long-chain acyl-CoA synthetase